MKKILALILIVLMFIFYNGDLKYTIKKYIEDDLDKVSMNEMISYEVVEENNKAIDLKTDLDINNYQNIKIGDSLASVIKRIGNPGRIDDSEYRFKWYVYNQYGEKFAMVGIEDDTVVALYSNSINTCESESIKLNYDRSYVRENYNPLEYKKKGNTRYIISSQDQYDIIKKGKKYITIFYDIL